VQVQCSSARLVINLPWTADLRASTVEHVAHADAGGVYDHELPREARVRACDPIDIHVSDEGARRGLREVRLGERD
jgi:hypothetical protein